MNELIYWIWLSLSTTPGSPTFKKLIDAFSGAKEIYEAELYDISKYIGSRSSDRAKLAEKDLTKAVEIYNYCEKYNIGILAYPDEMFPVSLREIDTPPVLLYYRGKIPDFNKRFSLAVVGTRNLSDYGRRAAFVSAYEISLAGGIIVSGMAMGIDGVAHAGALAAGGVTVAVIGTGINVCYPKDHQTLAREIVKNGCVLTEFAPGTPPSRTSFPKRNRIISGLCAATLVVEGKERSGSLITARCAKEQGRTVYALPGNINSKNSEAANILLKSGAKVFTSSDDVIKDFSDTYRGVLNPFNLPQRVDLDIKAFLRKYGVIAVAPDDDIFDPPFASEKKRQKSASLNAPMTLLAEEDGDVEPSYSEPPASFDKTALAVYKKIPLRESCSIESLIDAEMSMRVVMQALLKLEMGHFVEICPGEVVKRKLN